MRFFAVIGLALLLSACGPEKTRVVTNTINTQPLGVAIPMPTRVTLLPTKLDAPRDMKTKMPNPEYADCLSTPPEQMDTTTAYRCLINPIDYQGSNLYRGFDRASFKNYQINQVRVDAYVRTLEGLIAQHNKKVEEDNARIKAENAAQPTPTPTP